MSRPSFSHSSEAEQAFAPPEARRWIIWPWLLLAVALVLVMFVRGSLLTRTRADAGANHIGVGQPVVAFDLEPLTGEGEPLSIDDLKGQVTLVNFWGPWCGPCRVETPVLMEVVQHHKSAKKFQFVSVSCSFDPSDEADLAEHTLAFQDDLNVKFPTWHDPTLATRNSLMESAGMNSFAYPTTIVIDQSATIRGIWPGYATGDELAINAVIAELLRQNPASDAPLR
jgi:thiol-disulfide isomerase/thioredoxin